MPGPNEERELLRIAVDRARRRTILDDYARAHDGNVAGAPVTEESAGDLYVSDVLSRPLERCRWAGCRREPREPVIRNGPYSYLCAEHYEARREQISRSQTEANARKRVSRNGAVAVSVPPVPAYVCHEDGCLRAVASSRGPYSRCDEHRAAYDARKNDGGQKPVARRANGNGRKSDLDAAREEVARRELAAARRRIDSGETLRASGPLEPAPAVGTSFADAAEELEAAREERDVAQAAYSEALARFKAHPLLAKIVDEGGL